MNSIPNKHAAGAAVSYVIFALAIRLSGFSLDTIVGVMNRFIQGVFTSGGSLSAIGFALEPFYGALVALVFLTLGIAFLASDTGDDYRTGAAAGAVGAVAIIIATLSLMGVVIGAVLILISAYAMPLSDTYSKELKKWVKYRIGSNTAGKTLLVFNVVIVLSVFLFVLGNTAAYEQQLRDDLVNTVLETTGSGADVEAQVEEALENSPFFDLYARWLPISSAIIALALLEFLRTIVLTNLSGVFTKILIMRGTEN